MWLFTPMPFTRACSRLVTRKLSIVRAWIEPVEEDGRRNAATWLDLVGRSDLILGVRGPRTCTWMARNNRRFDAHTLTVLNKAARKNRFGFGRYIRHIWVIWVIIYVWSTLACFAERHKELCSRLVWDSWFSMGPKGTASVVFAVLISFVMQAVARPVSTYPCVLNRTTATCIFWNDKTPSSEGRLPRQHTFSFIHSLLCFCNVDPTVTVLFHMIQWSSVHRSCQRASCWSAATNDCKVPSDW